MKKTLLFLITAAGFASPSTLAAPFNSLDARSMAMGDVGVASSKPGSAAIFNPALLSENNYEHRISIIFPNIGVEAFASEDGFNAVQNIVDDEYVDQLSDTVSDYNSASAAGRQAAAAELANISDNFNKELDQLSEEPFNINAGANFAVAIPNKSLGFSVYSNTQAVIETSPFINECDLKLLDDYSGLADSLAEGTPPPASTVSSSCNGNTRVIFENDDFVDPESSFASEVDIAGVSISELGVALSRQFSIANQDISFGITPKLMTITSYYTRASIEELEDSDYEIEDELQDSEKEESDFNIDFGLATSFLPAKELTLGFTLKNILSKSYQTATDSSGERRKFSLKPQARAGIAWQLPLGVTVASDLDLTKNSALFNDQDTRYLGLGAEWNALDILRLRAGLRSNIENNDDQVLTAGIGLNIIAFHLDLAGHFSPNNAGAALQMGVEF